MNGQKVWTTLAHVAHFGILLARTDPDAPAQEGITYFVVDMRTPGIEVRPLVQMTGTHEFNEVFFTDVRVPAANVVGVEHDGWRLAKVTLGNERVSLSGEGALWGRGPTADDVIDLVRAHGGTTRSASSASSSRGSTPKPRCCGSSGCARCRHGCAASSPGPEASVRKAMSDEHGQHVMALAKTLARRARHARRPRPVRRGRRRHVELRLPLLPRAHDRRRHQRGAAQHPRREGPRPPASLTTNLMALGPAAHHSQ